MTEAPAAPTDTDEASKRGTLVGSIVSGRYRVDRLLGEGGMGGVYLAEHTHMRKLVALKVLHPEMTSMPEVVARFEREAVAAANIDHPHVAAATDFGTTENGAFYLVLEYVDGRSLRVELTRGPMSPGRALHIARQIALALVRAHELGFVHRDLKPDNVMLVERHGDPDFVKVLDFGIAKVPLEQMGTQRKANGTGAPLTRVGSVFGTPEYMAPEQALGQEVDARADLYALGVMLYEMLAGAPPFVAETITALLTKQLTEPPIPLSSRLPAGAIPPGVEALVHALLQKEASQRPPSAAAVVEAIEAAAVQGGFALGSSGERRSALGSLPGAGSGPTTSGALGSAATALPGSGAFSAADAMARTNYATGSSLGSSLASATRGSVVGGAPGQGPLGRIDVQALAGELWAHMRKLPPAARWALGGGSVVFVAISFILLALMLRPAPAPSAPGATASAAPAAPKLPWTTPKATDDELSRAKGAGRAALEQLAFTYPEDPRVVRALIEVHRAERQYGLLLKQVEKLLKLERSAREDATIVDAVAAATQAGGETTDAALALLEDDLGEAGVDALYDLATAKNPSPLRTKAGKSLDKPAVRDHASKATAFLIDFRAAKKCEDKRALLDRARDDGDARAYVVVKQLAEGKGCGFLSLSDCYPCLRSKDAAKDLKETISALEEKKAK